MPEVEWVNLKARDIRTLQEKDAIAIIPIGSIEQHGPHLPVQVDTLLAGEVARRTARLLVELRPWSCCRRSGQVWPSTICRLAAP